MVERNRLSGFAQVQTRNWLGEQLEISFSPVYKTLHAVLHIWCHFYLNKHVLDLDPGDPKRSHPDP